MLTKMCGATIAGIAGMLAALVLPCCIGDTATASRPSVGGALPPRMQLDGSYTVFRHGGHETIVLGGMLAYIEHYGDAGILVGLCDERPMLSDVRRKETPEQDLQVRDAFTNWYVGHRAVGIAWPDPAGIADVRDGRLRETQRRKTNDSAIADLLSHLPIAPADAADAAQRQTIGPEMK